MKIGWWAEVSITPDTFVFGTPNNHVPLIREAQRRGHEVELIHVPWKVDGEYVLEKPEWEHLRPTQSFHNAIARREAMELLVRRNSGLDASMRTFDAARKYCSENEPDELPYDVVFMKLPPPGFLRTKLEVVYNMWRFCKAGMPVFCFDGDLMWDQAVSWFEAQPWEQSWVHARTPYRPKKELPSWRFQPYWYDRDDELSLTTPIGEMRPKVHDLGYVGNDWKMIDSPRAAGLGKFYARGDNAIWGRWTADNRLLSGVPLDCFRGPVNAAHVRLCYQKCKASVVLGLPAYYKVGLVTQRYREIIQAGALCLIDAAYPKEITDLYVDPKYRVASAEDVASWISCTFNPATYFDLLIEQREYVWNRLALWLKSWIDQLEELAGRETKT